MHATSVCCRPSPERAAARGFTLLELLVVMALVGLAVGLVAPAAQRGLDAAQARGIAGDMSAALNSLPVRAFQRGAVLTVDEAALRQLLPALPGDWRIGMPQPLRYGPTGVASGGLVRLTPPGRPALEWTVQALTGQAERAGGPDAR